MAQEMFRSDDDLPEADRQILNAIRKRLWGYEPLRATRPVLNVSVRDGRVHLSGRVRTAAIKEIAEVMVDHLPGVRAVRNELVADPEVTRAVADALAVDPEIGPACPVVEAREGVVILVGEVPSEEAARRAVEIASAVPTVASVTSHLRVAAGVPAGASNGLAARAAGGGA